jgi:hypothetical protein
MLKETTVTERAATRGRQRGFDMQAEAIELRDADSRRALANAQELYASAEARANVVIRQEVDLTARQVNQRAREVEELERQLLEREQLDDITLCRELEVLGTREADLDRERKDLEDARAQILVRELDAETREAGLRDQEARLAAQERQLAERQMQELAVARKGLEDLQASCAGDAQHVWSFLGQADAASASFDFSPVRTGDAAPEGGVVVPLLDSVGTKISQL